MTEILEDTEEYIVPDAWAGIRTTYDPRRQAELDELKREFFLRGGVAQWIPPEPTRVERKNALYYASAKVAEHEAKRRVVQKATDLPMVERMREYMAGPVTSRAIMNKALGLSDSKCVRLINLYLKDEPLAEPYMARLESDLQAETRERDDARLAQLNSAMALGIRGWNELCKATGMTHNTLQRLVSIHGLIIRKTTVRNDTATA